MSYIYMQIDGSNGADCNVALQETI